MVNLYRTRYTSVFLDYTQAGYTVYEMTYIYIYNYIYATYSNYILYKNNKNISIKMKDVQKPCEQGWEANIGRKLNKPLPYKYS